jgi:hypothetical protein
VNKKYYEDVPAAVHAAKRHETLALKASKAFRSIKNISRRTKKSTDDAPSTSRSIASSSHIPPSSQPPAVVSVPPGQSTSRSNLSRRGSVIHKFFSPPSAESFDFVQPRPLSPSQYSLVSQEAHEDSDDWQRRSTSPTPSHETSASRPRRRFSVLNLFSRAEEFPDSPSSLSTTNDDPSCHSRSSLSSAPVTPVGESEKGHPIAAPPSSQPLLKRYSSFVHGKRSAKTGPVNDNVPSQSQSWDDVDYEMKLDSLHFDELTFDVDRFQL